ncbi:HEAT repeat-containing protein 4 isoform X1 [Engystomops pustulosus]|uniref:HEAT repeat-containing protein 4 isoform X1 n=1 Tax=Engystomops pustulosus TaxID=76066 RepID=UPI003AFAB965
MKRPTLYCEQNVFCLDPCKINAIPSQKHLSMTESHTSSQHYLKCQEIYIQKIAGDLRFSKEVIKDRGFASLSYQEWDAKDLYNALDVIPQRGMKTLLKTQPKQHKLQQKPHHVSYVEPSAPTKKLKSKSCILFGNSPWRKPEDEQRHDGSGENLKPQTFLREESNLLTRREKVPYKENLIKSDNSTDVLLSRLTKPTARWIVGHHIESKDAKEKLSKQYGSSITTELINDEHMTEEDFTTFKDQKYKPVDHKDIKQERKPETLLPVFYKIPGFVSPQKQVQEAGGKNKTAESLAVKHFELSPPLKLQDLMNPKAGKHVFETENDYERELYSGASKIIHQKDTNQMKYIVMESNSRYEKHVQQSVPRSYKKWISSDEKADTDRPFRPEKGAQRWVALPTVVVDMIERHPQKETSNTVKSERDQELKEINPGVLNKKKVLENIASQWRSAWLLSTSWKEVTLEQLARDLGNVHNSHKISALITMASSAIAAPQKIAFPAEIINLVSNALQDKDGLVRMAAALCQYLIQEVSDEARKIMNTSLEIGTDADSWTAAQCLALEGNHSYLVIKRILEQLFATNKKETQEQALYILRELSKHTNLIHAMLGEALNSGNWGERIMSCKVLSILNGNISQGVKNKLSQLMWNDWSPAVRGAAAKALGQLDQGKEVHDQIRKHLDSDSWKTQVEALSLIGFLQIMTAQLLPGFLQCFDSDFSAVRRQACRAAGLLQIKDEMVMNCLYQLVQNDPVWKIKTHAIKALGKIGHITPRVKELLLWALRLKEPGVRIEAYRCIEVLSLCDDEVQHALQDRLILESHELARRQLKQTLTAFNLPHNGNQEMMSQVKHQLSKLCQKKVLFPKVLKLDEDLASGQTEPEPVQDWKMQEQGFHWDIVDKDFSGQSCPSAMSGMEYKSTDTELQVLMDNDSRPLSHQTVSTTHLTAETPTTTDGTSHSTNMFHTNLNSSTEIKL